MDGIADELLVFAAKQMRGVNRQLFLADVCDRLCDGEKRRAESRFGWGRDTITKGMTERALSCGRAVRPSVQ